MIPFLPEFFHVFAHYAQELWWILLLGFLLSGLFNEFVPTGFVEKHLGEKGLKPILIASLVGVVLPVCCLGSLPIALTLRKKGASLGAVLAFLVATPATSISALFVCFKLMGFVFTTFVFFAVISMAIVMGFVSNGIKQKASAGEEGDDDCCHDSGEQEAVSVNKRIRKALYYALVTLPKDIGFEIIIGVAIASFITVFEPLQHFIQTYLVGLLGYAFILVIGLISYVCSTASVPMADALVQSGMTQGQAMCYLIVGPITSYGTLLVVKKEFGFHVLTLYLSIICIFALLSGMIFDLFITNP